jgi:hypothetical protein
MNEDDKQLFKQGRPFIVGVVALAFALRRGPTPMESPETSFALAEAFVKEFERRNDCQSG